MDQNFWTEKLLEVFRVPYGRTANIMMQTVLINMMSDFYKSLQALPGDGPFVQDYELDDHKVVLLFEGKRETAGGKTRHLLTRVTANGTVIPVISPDGTEGIDLTPEKKSHTVTVRKGRH